jgi:hypothetical protein
VAKGARWADTPKAVAEASDVVFVLDTTGSRGSPRSAAAISGESTWGRNRALSSVSLPGPRDCSIVPPRSQPVRGGDKVVARGCRLWQPTRILEPRQIRKPFAMADFYSRHRGRKAWLVGQAIDGS